MACSNPAAFAGPAAATAASMPALSFSNTRGGPNRSVGRTWTRYATSVLWSGQQVTVVRCHSQP